MRDVAGLIAKAAEKTGFRRDFFKVEDIPTEPSNISIVTFFGDMRSLFLFSSLFLHRYKEQDKPSKYMILCSWPGFASFFPYVNEYWSLESEGHVKKLFSSTDNFGNKSELIGNIYRNLNQYFFEDIISADQEIDAYYKNGITDEFWHKYKSIKRFLPNINGSSVLGKDFNKDFIEKGGYKVLVYPNINLVSWQDNRTYVFQSPKEFWVALLERLVAEGFVPVVCKSLFTHDLSSEFSKNCVYFSEIDMGKVMSAMRLAGCVLDIFGGISRVALAARTPFLCVDDRGRYSGMKEYEIDDLCGFNIPKKYIFSFSTIINGGNKATWDFDIFNLVVAKLRDLLPSIDRDQLPSAMYSMENVSYEVVRERKLNRIGARLLKTPRED